MAQHDYVIANGTGAAVRSDLNGSLAAIVSNNSGATEPTTMYAYQWWADTTTGLLKQRNAANNAWVTVGTLASANLGLLPVAGGTMTGVLAVTAGTAALPGIAVSGDLNTGLFSSGADAIDIATAGTRRFGVSSAGELTVYGGNLTLNGQGDLRLADSDSSNYVALQAPATVASNVTFTLPSADGTNGQVLATNGTGTLSFTAAGGASNLADGTAATPSVNFSSDTDTGVFRAGANRLAFATNGASVGEFDGSDLKFNSGYGSVATAYGCRAWVNFNGTANSNLSGTYSQSGTTVTVTATAHGLLAGSSINVDATSGTAVDGIYTVTTVTDANTFTYTAGTSLTTSGNITLLRNTIRASGNVSSITDNGTGDYTVNFTTAMVDANYSVTGSAQFDLAGVSTDGFAGVNPVRRSGAYSTASIRVSTTRPSDGAVLDYLTVTLAIFR
jgi:hypothetical protein